MRRTGLLQLALLCFVFASDLTEWQWFEVVGGPDSAPGAQCEVDAYPFALKFRQQVLEQIAVPPTLCCGLHYEIPTPSDPSSSFVSDAHPGTYPGVALVYSHMSLQR